MSDYYTLDLPRYQLPLAGGFALFVGAERYALKFTVGSRADVSVPDQTRNCWGNYPGHVSILETYLGIPALTTLDPSISRVQGSIRKPTFTKCYVAVFVSLSVKATHLEPVTELTTSAFIATLRRFVARRGLPGTIWSDNGTNFVGAATEIRRLIRDQELTNHCSNRGIQWKFTPEHAPHFGGCGKLL